jgi:hypothetical protein
VALSLDFNLSGKRHRHDTGGLILTSENMPLSEVRNLSPSGVKIDATSSIFPRRSLSMSELAGLPTSAAMTALVERAEEFVRAAKAPATLRAYRCDWVHFEAWCHKHQFSALPAEPTTVALYPTDLAGTPGRSRVGSPP